MEWNNEWRNVIYIKIGKYYNVTKANIMEDSFILYKMNLQYFSYFYCTTIIPLYCILKLTSQVSCVMLEPLKCQERHHSISYFSHIQQSYEFSLDKASAKSHQWTLHFPVLGYYF